MVAHVEFVPTEGGRQTAQLSRGCQGLTVGRRRSGERCSNGRRADGIGRRVHGYVRVVPAPIPPADADQRARQQWVNEQRQSPDSNAPRLLAGSPITSSHAESWDRRHWTSRFVHHLGSFAAHPAPAIGAVTLVSAWAVLGMLTRFPVWWQTVLYSVTASVTFVMVFVIQHAQDRQTSATQRKLDELIRSSSSADDALIAVEEADDGHLQALASLNYSDRQRATEDSSR